VHQFTFHPQLERMMQLLRDDQVSATDVLHRICLHVAFATANPGRVTGGRKVELLAIGRAIMRLAPPQRRGKRYPSRSLALLGEMVMDDGLYLFAIKLIDKLKIDDERKRAMKEAALDFDTPGEVPADQPRAGVRYRKRRGVQVP
jgi:antitoxin (DNA-binding transcriptional repressor) of toxin-antitoxin stability system